MMNKLIKININGKDYYCDNEVLKLIMRNDDKRESLEYQNKELNSYLDTHFNIEHNLVERIKLLQQRIDKAIEYIEKNIENRKGLSVEEYKVKWRSLFDYYESEDIMKDLLNILKGSEE